MVIGQITFLVPLKHGGIQNVTPQKLATFVFFCFKHNLALLHNRTPTHTI
jgi:hypothetical protein